MGVHFTSANFTSASSSSAVLLDRGLRLGDESLGGRLISGTTVDRRLNRHLRSINAYACFPPLALPQHDNESSTKQWRSTDAKTADSKIET